MTHLHWNYRVMQHIDGDSVFLAIHEVYYKAGLPSGWTAHGARVGGDTVEELRTVLQQMLRALDAPVLAYVPCEIEEDPDDA